MTDAIALLAAGRLERCAVLGVPQGARVAAGIARPDVDAVTTTSARTGSRASSMPRTSLSASTATTATRRRTSKSDTREATRAALEEGIVPGGGVALLRAGDSVTVDTFDGDERTGAKIVLRSLEEPLRQIAENAGFEGSVVVNEVRRSEAGVGLNAATGEYTDLVAAGVIRKARDGVKLLGKGELKSKIEITVHHASAAAQAAS